MVTIRAAVRYFLEGVSGGARRDIVKEIITIVRQVSTTMASRALGR
jgi:hypothetical protein